MRDDTATDMCAVAAAGDVGPRADPDALHADAGHDPTGSDDPKDRL